MQTSESIKPDRVKQQVFRERALAPLDDWQVHAWGVTVTLGHRRVALQALGQDILRLVLCDEHGDVPLSTVGVLPDAIQPEGEVRVAAEETGRTVTLRLGTWKVKIDRDTGHSMRQMELAG
ncbi:hypothetical protein GCM10025858_19470 [Alicyclobacillus sacchari]|uniref:hypothetical protein n=1 Tax=Alicyclobacillus sacchari TaxID=392010 RepID=UPI0023E95F8C|nr:hypothetical protein [Alicyclobacillus sacchari]GMA57444.1 hypothetical protein GCM10025858_19470 [Alicyclobacillus sacchari]